MSGPFGSSQFMYATGAAEEGQSLRFEDGDVAYLSRTPASAGNRKTWTWSGWVKRGNLTNFHSFFSAYSSSTSLDYIFFNNNDTLAFRNFNGTSYDLITNAVFRDPSAWYHIVLSVDTTQTTSSDRVKVYVNGETQSLGTATYPSQNYDFLVNSTVAHYIGYNGYNYHDGYLANVTFIDGTALDPTSFGKYDGTLWKPKDVSGLTFGTNGFFLDFSDSSAIGDDTSGNANDWTANNLVATDVVPDSPVSGGNFAVLNPLDRTSTTITLSEGNLRWSKNSGDFHFCGLTIPFPQSGKWYAEARAETTITAGYGGSVHGYNLVGQPNYPTSGFGNTGNGVFVYDTNNSSGSTIRINSTNGGGLQTVGGGDAGDIMQFAFDADSGKCWLGKNGTWYGNNTGVPAAITLANLEAGNSPIDTFTAAQMEEGVTIMLGYSDQQKTAGWRFNAGADSSFQGVETPQGNADDNGVGDFYYAPPSGFLALTTGNLPTPTITAPDEYFNTVLYTGTGSSQSITGTNFQPDWIWWKGRNASSSHLLMNAVVGNTKYLYSNSTAAEQTDGTNVLTSFDSDGFTLPADTGGYANFSGRTYVAWNWLAGNGTVSNTDGSITSTVSANQTAGFSVVGYTGTGSAATVGHGLSQKPDVVLIKDRDAANNWQFNTDVIDGSYDYLYLNTTAAKGDHSISAPTSSVFNLGTGAIPNTSGNNYIAYCFHSVDGYSKCGVYSGNSSSDGVFVHTGFRVSYLLVKSTSSATQWMIYDNKREGYNVDNDALCADDSSVEKTDNDVDFLSNGFKLRRSSPNFNYSGYTYIFYAVAEAPFKSANAR